MSERAIRLIEDNKRYGSNNSTIVMEKLMGLLGNIQDELKCIHIAGTNGKGSTSSLTASILEEAGYKVGLYTSPYIEVFNERIQINRENINSSDLDKYVDIVKEKIDILEAKTEYIVTSFEFVTAVAFVYFYYEEVDYVVLETGVGGLTDATNVIKNPLISIITTIDFDHIKKLGPGLKDIAYHKSGIIKKNCLTCSYYQKDEVLEVIKEKCEKENSSLFLLDDIEIYDVRHYIDKTIYSLKYKEYVIENIEISLLGKYQVFNSALSILAILTLIENKIIDIKIQDILLGLKKATWMGRVELINKRPFIILDGAHNKQGAHNLKEVVELYKDGNVILVMAMLEGKNNEEVVREISEIVNRVIITQVDSEYRRLNYKELEKIFLKYKEVDYSFSDNEDAIKKAICIAKETDLIIFMGSLYFVGDVRKKINHYL